MQLFTKRGNQEMILQADVPKKLSWYQRNKEEAKRRNRLWALEHPGRNAEMKRNNYHRRKNDPDNMKKNMWKHAKVRATKKNIPFTITFEDIHIPEKCPVFNRPFTKVGENWSTSPSLDRIVPELGYVPGNIQVISRQANVMKWDASKEDLILFCKGMLMFLGKEVSLDSPS
jgi:hypothetical protein